MSLMTRLLLIIAATALAVLALFGLVWFVAAPRQETLQAAQVKVTTVSAAVTATLTPAATATPLTTATPLEATAAVSPSAEAVLTSPLSTTAEASGTASATMTASATVTSAAAVTSTAEATATANVSGTAGLPAGAHPTQLAAPQLYTYKVVNVYPHDIGAFTEGLIVRDGYLYESTGREGQSNLRKVDIATGKVLENRKLGSQYFGEGLTELNGNLYQLTWKNGEGFIYDFKTLEPTGSFNYTGEGWGMTTDGKRLIVSDGTPTLQFWDPATMQRTGGVVVSLLGLPMQQINELEYISGSVYANIWQTNLIVRIDPATGNITGVADLTGLLDNAPADLATPQPAQPGQAAQSVPPYQPDVLNGIAFDQQTGRLFVTGKLWPATFEIELIAVPPPPSPAKIP